MYQTRKMAIAIFIIIVLLLAFFIYRRSNTIIKEVSYTEINKKVKEDEYALVIVGNIDLKTKEYLLTINKSYGLKLYNTTMTLAKLKELINNKEYNVDDLYVYLLYNKGKLLGVYPRTMAGTEFTNQLDKHILGIIPENERYYKTPNNTDDLVKKINDKKFTIITLGTDSCTYCKLFLPVLNTVAKEHKLDIYYINSSTYSDTEYKKLLELDYKISKECTYNEEEDTTLSKDDFPFPLTVITKSGNYVGCIKGYYNEKNIVSRLKEFKVIKGEK